MKTIIAVLSTALLANVAHAATTVEGFTMYNHQSDLFRGSLIPFGQQEYEPTNDYVAGGLTVEHGNVELDLSVGAITVDCNGVRNCKWKAGGQVMLRYNPWGKVFTPFGDAYPIKPFLGLKLQEHNKYAGVGFTFSLGKRFELDVSHGAKFLDYRGNKAESGTELALRLYPGRRHSRK